jgi:hypothetical protein
MLLAYFVYRGRPAARTVARMVLKALVLFFVMAMLGGLTHSLVWQMSTAGRVTYFASCSALVATLLGLLAALDRPAAVAYFTRAQSPPAASARPPPA